MHRPHITKLYQIMINNHIGIVILARVVIGAAICPYITALLVIAPSYIDSSGFSFIVFGMLQIAVYLSYAVAIIIGLPTILFLAVKNKCSYKAFAITGFILGTMTYTVFFIYLQAEFNSHAHSIHNQDTSITNILSIIMYSLWYGFSASVGAILFGFISSLPKWYNKSSNLTGAHNAPSS